MMEMLILVTVTHKNKSRESAISPKNNKSLCEIIKNIQILGYCTLLMRNE